MNSTQKNVRNKNKFFVILFDAFNIITTITIRLIALNHAVVFGLSMKFKLVFFSYALKLYCLL